MKRAKTYGSHSPMAHEAGMASRWDMSLERRIPEKKREELRRQRNAHRTIPKGR